MYIQLSLNYFVTPDTCTGCTRRYHTVLHRDNDKEKITQCMASPVMIFFPTVFTHSWEDIVAGCTNILLKVHNVRLSCAIELRGYCSFHTPPCEHLKSTLIRVPVYREIKRRRSGLTLRPQEPWEFLIRCEWSVI